MNRVAKRYAKALFELAKEEDKLSAVRDDFKVIAGLIEERGDFRSFLENPLISERNKSDTMKRLLDKKISVLSYHFLLLLAKKKRSAVLPAVVQQFHRLMLEYENKVEGDVVSAADLNDEQLDKIKKHVQQAIGKEVILKQRTDAGVIGGFVVKVEDLIIDSSIRYQLNKLREKLIAR